MVKNIVLFCVLVAALGCEKKVSVEVTTAPAEVVAPVDAPVVDAGPVSAAPQEAVAPPEGQ